MLEDSQIVPTPKTISFSDYSQFNQPQQRPFGIQVDINEIEALQHSYPETLGFLTLIKNLLLNGNLNLPPAIYEQLGSPQRQGGVKPYITFVIDEIFMKLNDRIFINQSEKWKILSLCLDIFNISVELLDISQVIFTIANTGTHDDNNFEAAQSLSIHSQGITAKPESASIPTIGLQPGFEVFCRILSGSAFTRMLFKIIKEGSILSKIPKEATVSVTSCLQLFNTIFELQKPFIEEIAPLIFELGHASACRLPSSLTTLEELLSGDSEVVTQILSFILIDFDGLCLEALNALSFISRSSTFSATCYTRFAKSNRLVSIISHSSDSMKIIEGFVSRIDTVTFESGENTTHAVQLSILDMLISNVQNTNSPNIAHFLLGLATEKSLDVPEKWRSRRFCLESIVDKLLSKNFYETHPLLAEKCYRLVYLLCRNSETCKETLHLLRMNNFFTDQLKNFVTLTDDGLSIGDSSIARIYQCSWLLRIICIEIHVSLLSGTRMESDKIIGLLYKSFSNEPLNLEYDDVMNSNFEQSLPIAVDLIKKLNVSESDRPILNLAHTTFNQIPLQDYIIRTDRGTEIYDVENLKIAMLFSIQSLAQQGTYIQNLNGNDGGVNNLIQIAIDANFYMELENARHQSAVAWCELIKESILGYYDLLKDDFEPLILVLLSQLLMKANAPKTAIPIGNIFSETILTLLSMLEETQKRKNK